MNTNEIATKLVSW